MRKVFTGALVWDVRAGRAEAADVVVEDGMILEVAAGLDGDEAVDCEGDLLLPGFIDCHTHVALDLSQSDDAPRGTRHLLGAARCRTLLDLGVTTVRDAWGADVALRQAVEQGWLPGPRLLVSLRQLGVTGGIGDHWSASQGQVDYFGDPSMPDPVFDGEDSARAAARRMLRAGADWLKVCATGSALGPAARYEEITLAELAALVDEAARRGERRVMAHAHGARGAETAARAGARSIEHGLYLDEAAVGVMSERGTWLVPTLSVSHGGDVLDPKTAEVHRASVRLALDAGVSIAMGTDCPMRPHEETLKEIGYLAAAGLGAEGAVRAATYDAARLLEVDTGEVTPGKPADLVLLRARAGSDPLGDVSDLTERVRAVWRGGHQVSPTGPVPF